MPFVNVVPAGLEEISKPWPLPPVTSPVADPVTPLRVAVMVTPVTAPRPDTLPAVTGAQALELCQEADPVTSLLPLLKVAVAKSLTVDPCATVKLLEPPPLAPVVTTSEVG